MRKGLAAIFALAAFTIWYRRLPVGTRSILMGAHFPPIHGYYTALAWKAIYGSYPRHAMPWVAFFVHDLGYWGLDNMDGPIGQDHPKLGAQIMYLLFDHSEGPHTWHDFAAGHSRYYAKKHHIKTSPLMRADKYATAMYPLWLYLALVLWSGECWEYVALHLAYNNKQGTGNRWRDLWWWATDLRAEWARKYGPVGA